MADDRIVVGSLAGAGTLGFLIPPSIPMIIYAVLAEESLLRLFTAGFLPGFALDGCFMGYMAIRTILNPKLVPADDHTTWTWGDRFKSLIELGPVAFLILTVLGTMYAGIASPSEASAMKFADWLRAMRAEAMLSVEYFDRWALDFMREEAPEVPENAGAAIFLEMAGCRPGALAPVEAKLRELGSTEH